MRADRSGNPCDLVRRCSSLPCSSIVSFSTPLSLTLRPIDNAPLVYRIPAAANNSSNATYPVSAGPIRNSRHDVDIQLELELSEGTRYTLLVLDGANNYSNSTLLRTVGARTNGTRNTCSGAASTSRTPLGHYILLGGSLSQCSLFKGYFSGYKSRAASFNFTILPLDQSFTAFDVDVNAQEEVAGIWNWTVALAESMRFSIMLK
jgi:hypothetical protein